MRIFIITMDDPIITNNFFKKIISYRKDDIVGLAVSKEGRLKVTKKSKLEYLFCLFWILGPIIFFRNIIQTIIFKIDIFICQLFSMSSQISILHFAQSNGIGTFSVDNPNESKFIEKVKTLNPDVIINQSQTILKKEILDVPKYGVINRHNSLLPRHKGRITPFWVKYFGDKHTGVTIHFVNDEIDKGEIIYQFKYSVNSRTFNEIVDTNYRIAPLAMLKALDLLEKKSRLKFKSQSKGNYNSTPTFSHILEFLKKKYG